MSLKKILPVIFAAAVMFAGCSSDAQQGISADLNDEGSAAQISAEEQIQKNETDMNENENGEGVSSADGQETEARKSEAVKNDPAAKGSESEETVKTAAGTQKSPSAAVQGSGNAGASAGSVSTADTLASVRPATEAPEPVYKYKDGTYSGSAQGFNGPVTVSVSISSDKITSVSVASSSDDEPFITDAKALCQKIVSANSADVSAVSGATYSSNGIKGAVKDALSKAENK